MSFKEIDFTGEFNRLIASSAPLDPHHAIDQAKARCDGLAKHAPAKEVAKAMQKVPKWGVRIDSEGNLVPIRNLNMRTKQEEKQRNDAFLRQALNSDPEFTRYLMRKTYGHEDGGAVIDNFLRSSGMRVDNEGSIYFARELEYFEAVSKDILYPAANYNQIWGVDASAGAGAERTTFSQYDFQATPVLANSNSNFSPLVNMTGVQYSYNIYTIKLAFRKTFQEIRNAIFANKPYDAMQVGTARMAVEQAINQWAFLGNPQYELPGLFSIPGATALPASTASGGAVTWAQKVAAGDVAAIQADLLSVVNQIIDPSKGTQAPDTLVLPIESYILLFGTPRSDNSDTTIGSFFMQNNPSITRVFWSHLANQATSVEGTNALVMFDSAEERIKTMIPMPYTQYAPVIEGTAYRVETETRFGGVACYYPNAIAYMTGF